MKTDIFTVHPNESIHRLCLMPRPVDESDAEWFRSETEECFRLAEKAVEKADREACVQGSPMTGASCL
jgi:hypothetical protein